MFLEKCFMCVVYFDQQMGALHPGCWSNSFSFFIAKTGKAYKKWNKHDQLIFSFGVIQRLGVNQCLRIAPKCWCIFTSSTKHGCIFFTFLLVFTSFLLLRWKRYYNAKKMISTSKRLVEIHNICGLATGSKQMIHVMQQRILLSRRPLIS